MYYHTFLFCFTCSNHVIAFPFYKFSSSSPLLKHTAKLITNGCSFSHLPPCSFHIPIFPCRWNRRLLGPKRQRGLSCLHLCHRKLPIRQHRISLLLRQRPSSGTQPCWPLQPQQRRLHLLKQPNQSLPTSRHQSPPLHRRRSRKLLTLLRQRCKPSRKFHLEQLPRWPVEIKATRRRRFRRRRFRYRIWFWEILGRTCSTT